MREGSGHLPKVKDASTWQTYPIGRSPVSSQKCAWRTRGGSPLPWNCRRHHYRGKSGNDGQDRLVLSHRCSVPDGLKDNTERSPVGLCHRPRPRDKALYCCPRLLVPLLQVTIHHAKSSPPQRLRLPLLCLRHQSR
jgi:hypothetical protein